MAQVDNFQWVEDYFDKPFRQLAYGPDAFDCYGLVWHVCMHHGGIQLPRFDDIEYQAARIDATIKGQALSDDWQALGDEQPQSFDVAVMRRAGEALHVGVYLGVDGGRILHATRTGVYCSDTKAIYRMNYRHLEFYRYAANRTPQPAESE